MYEKSCAPFRRAHCTVMPAQKPRYGQTILTPNSRIKANLFHGAHKDNIRVGLDPKDLVEGSEGSKES